MGVRGAEVDRLWEADPERRLRVQRLVERFERGERLFEPGRLPDGLRPRIVMCTSCRAFVTLAAGQPLPRSWVAVREIRVRPSGRLVRLHRICPGCLKRMTRIA